MFKKLWKRTKEVATMYTGTFVVVMVLNQLLFFGFCLNPVCLIAAMPHVLFITVVIGTWINKVNGWGSGEVEKKTIKETSKVLPSVLFEGNKPSQDLNEKLNKNFDTNDAAIDFNAKNDREKTFGHDELPPWLAELPPLLEEYLPWETEPPPWLGEYLPWETEPPPWLGENQLWKTETPPWLVDEILHDASIWKSENKIFIENLNKYGITRVWHMTHRKNIEKIVIKGVLSNCLAYRYENPVDISNQGAQKWREKKEPIYNRKIHEYAPTYLNIKNPMLYVKKEIHEELCLLEISLEVLSSHAFVFTDGNAAARDTNFFRNVNDLKRLPWNVLNAAYWNDFPDGKRKRCAEVLIYPLIEPNYILKVHCNSFETLKYLQRFKLPSQISSELFFGSNNMICQPSTSFVGESSSDRPF